MTSYSPERHDEAQQTAQQPFPPPGAPMPLPGEGSARDLAYKRVKARRDFQAHLFVYLVVNLFLIGVWFVTGAGYFWPAWVLGGWGIGLVMNAWDVYMRRPISEDDVAREMSRR